MEQIENKTREQTHQIANIELSPISIDSLSLPKWIGGRANYSRHERCVYKGLNEALEDISQDRPPFYKMVEPKIKNEKFLLYPTIFKPTAPMAESLNVQYSSDKVIEKTLNLARNVKFLPARHICFGYPPFYPEKIEEGTLMSLAADQIQHWPIYQHANLNDLDAYRSIADIVKSVQMIEGDYHYIKFYCFSHPYMQLPRILHFIVQLTPYDLWELLKNPFYRKLVKTNGYPGQSLMFNIRINVPIVAFSGITDTYLMWDYLLNMSNTSSLFGYEMNDPLVTKVLLERFSELIHWDQRALGEFTRRCGWLKNEYLQLPETTFVKSYERRHTDQWWWRTNNRTWWANQYRKFKKARNKSILFQMGLVSSKFTMFGDGFTTIEEDAPGIFGSLKEIGKLAQNMNSATDQFKRICGSDIMTQLFSFVEAVQLMFADTIFDLDSIMSNPVAFFEKLVSDISLSFGPRTPTAKDIITVLGTLFGGVYLYPDKRIIGGALILYGTWSLGTLIFTDPKVQRTFAKLLFSVFIVLLEVTKSTKASSQTVVFQSDNSTLTNICVGGATALAIVFGSANRKFSFSSLFSYLATNTKDLFNVTRGFPTFIKTLELVLNMFKDGLTYIFGESAIYGSLVKCTITDKELREYIVYAMSTTTEDITTFTLDLTARDKWEEMCKLHNHFIQIFSSPDPPQPGHIGFSMYRNALTKFTELKREYNKIKSSINFYRPEPFMVWVWGEPGTGKTFGRDLMVKNLYRWHTTIDPTYDCISTGLLYVRNPADPYMSGYNGNFAAAYDDVGANRQATNPEFNEIMGMGSTNQVRLNMADLAEKGRFFSSKVIIMAANTRDVNANNLLLTEKAFNRRRHVVIQVERPNKTTTELTTSTKDFSQVRITVTDPQSEQTLKIFPETGYGENDDCWKQFHEWLAPLYEQHVRSQMKLLKAKDDELKAVLEKQPHPAIVELHPPKKEEESENEDFVDCKEEIPVKESIYPRCDLRKSLDEIYEKQFGRKITSQNDEIFSIRLARNMSQEIDEAILNLQENPGELTEIALIEIVHELLDMDINADHVKALKVPSFKVDEPAMKSLITLFTEYIQTKSAKFPWVKALAAVGALGSALSLYKLYKGKETEKPAFQAYDQPILNPPSKNVIFQSYDTPILNPPSKTVQFQSTTEDLIGLYKSNTYRAYRLYEGKPASVHCIALQYNTFLFPYHFLSHDNLTYQLCHPSRGYYVVNFGQNDFTRIGNTDWAVVNLPSLPHHKSIVQHFATEQQLTKTVVFNSMMLTLTAYKDTLEFSRHSTGVARRWDIPIEKTANGQSVYICSGYKYKYETSFGDCGALVLSTDNTSGAKIHGMHFGYSVSEGRGYCSLIPKEHLLKVIDTITPLTQKITPGDLNLQYSLSDAPPVIHKEGELPAFEYIGVVSDAPSQPLHHGPLQRSPAYGQIYEPTKDLAVLRKNDHRLDDKFKGDPDILERNVLDFDMNSLPWPNEVLSMAGEFLQHELESFKETIPREVQPLEWAINGTWIDEARLDNTEPINLHTSSGYGLKGVKFEHFDTTDPKCIKIKTPKLQQMVDDQWNDWMNGKTHPCIWTHALKSEALKHSKIKNGATRTFCVAQTSFLLNVRRLFGSFTVAMKNSKIKSFSCLGMDPRSAQWTDLYNDLREVSDIGCDMDFFKYDRTAVTSQLAGEVAKAINAWYNDDVKYQRARIIVINDLIHSYCLIKQYLTRKKRGNPSGNPLTTEMNNCVNLLMLCMVYMIVAKKKQPDQMTLKSFKKNIRAKFFGDDVIFAVSQEIIEWFTPDDISEIYAVFGVPVTPADKASKLTYRKLEELTFLKRAFVPFNDPRYPWQAGLDQNSVKNLTQFIRLEKHQGTAIDSITANFEDSLIESYHWGKEFFEEHKTKLNTWLKENEHPTLLITYSECDSAYRTKLGLTEPGFNSLSSKYEGQVFCNLREAFSRECANSVSRVATC